MFTKFEKEIIFVWKAFRFSIIKNKIKNNLKLPKIFQIFVALGIKTK